MEIDERRSGGDRGAENVDDVRLMSMHGLAARIGMPESCIPCRLKVIVGFSIRAWRKSGSSFSLFHAFHPPPARPKRGR